MYCKKCNVNIDCKTSVCPLCHNQLESIDVDKKPMQEYPTRKKHRPLSTPILDKIYMIAALNLFIISLILNLIFTPSVLWSLVVAVSLIYAYILIRATILDYKNFPTKVMTQAVLLTIVMMVIQMITDDKNWAFSYVVPSIFLVSLLSVCGYMLIKLKKANKYFLNLIAIALMGFIPLIINVIIKCEVMWPALTTAIVSIVALINLIIFAPKDILEQMKKWLHH